MNKKEQQQQRMENARKVAEKSYNGVDNSNNDDTEEGLAITHDQVSDMFMEGTIDQVIENNE